MRKIDYVRPLAEVIDLDVCDIIRTSEFSDKLGDVKGAALSDNSLDAYVNNGRIILN